ncbi:MAG: hypothetical protein KC457_20980, partial [Myxococcales bacterium]|nr:hypothetical protein [Myxococcales bacterium]
PPELWPERTGITALAPGLRDFFCAPELPRDWSLLRASLPPAANLGLLLRWSTGLAQIEDYYQTDACSRSSILHTWELAVPELLGSSPHVSLAPVEPSCASGGRHTLESTVTVFPFFLRRESRGPFLGKSELLRIFHWLNRNLADLLPEIDDSERAVLARKIHIGQPVLLTSGDAEERAVLRLAIGAALVTRVAGDLRLGATLAARQQWLRAQIQVTRAKLDLAIEHYDTLLARD